MKAANLAGKEVNKGALLDLDQMKLVMILSRLLKMP